MGYIEIIVGVLLVLLWFVTVGDLQRLTGRIEDAEERLSQMEGRVEGLEPGRGLADYDEIDPDA